MTDSDMFLIEADSEGNITLKDLYSKGPWYPKTDAHQDYSEPYDIQDSETKVRFKTRRLIDTRDEWDYVIPLDEEFIINWAGCPCSEKMNYHG